MVSAHRDLPANAPGAGPEPWPLRRSTRLRVVGSAQMLPAELARVDATKLGMARLVVADGQLSGQQSPHAALDTPESAAEGTVVVNGVNGHPPAGTSRTTLNGAILNSVPAEAGTAELRPAEVDTAEEVGAEPIGATELDSAEVDAADVAAAEREAAEIEAAELAAAESVTTETGELAAAGFGRSPADISELVAAAVRNERKAIEQLLAYIQPRVFRYCRGRVGRNDRSYTSADDVAQEVMVAVLRALPKYTERGRPFLAFVYGIAHNKVADSRRVSHRNRSDPYDEVPDSPEVGGGPEAAALAGELQDRLKKHLDKLQKNQRDILLYRVVVGLSAEETADVVGSTAGAVRVAQHRALTKLRSMLAGEPI